MDLKNIYRIIDEFSEPAYQACRAALYEPLEFHVLAVDEIRRGELKEKLADFMKICDANIGTGKSLEQEYADLVKGILDVNVFRAPDRNEKYYATACRCTQTMEGCEDPVPELETLVMIYISQMRTFDKENLAKKPKERAVLGKTQYHLLPADEGVISNIRLNVEQYRATALIAGKEISSRKKLEFMEKMFLQVVTIIMFWRVLQTEGEI